MSGTARWPSIVIAVSLITAAVWFLRPLVLFGWVAGERPQPAGVESVELTLSLPLPNGHSGTAAIPIRVWYPAHVDANSPLIIYGPALGGVRSDNTVLLQEVARRGYVVIGYDDIARDPIALAASEADAQVRTMQLRVGSDAENQQMLERFDRRTALQAEKVLAILDGVAQMPRVLPADIHADFSRIGVMGASFGGAVAAEAALRDPKKRVRAVINLDGWMRGLAVTRAIEAPFLIFNSTRGDIPISEINSAGPYRRFAAAMSVQSLAIQKRQLEARPDSLVVTVTGAAHSDFMDELYDGRRWIQWRPWRMRMIRPARMRAIVDSTVIAFLDEHLKGVSPPSSAGTVPPYDEVSIQRGARAANAQ